MRPAIVVHHNHLSDPAGHDSILLATRGTLRIEIVRWNDKLLVFASRRQGNASWTERAIEAPTVDEAAEVARRLFRELD